MNEFYNSSEWRKLRQECLHRDRYTCQRCDKRFKSDDLTGHHMIPRAEGGADKIQNLITLCSPCHDFVEIAGLKDKASIIGSYQTEPKEEQLQSEETEKEDRYHRPEWHKWVYGGHRNPRM